MIKLVSVLRIEDSKFKRDINQFIFCRFEKQTKQELITGPTDSDGMEERTLPITRQDLTVQSRAHGHHPSASNASQISTSSSSNTDESEESYLDSLEEGRAPLLGEDEEDNRRTHYCDDNNARHHRFPKERFKTVIACVLLFVAGCSNDLVLSYIHDFVPETAPLPDVVFANTPYKPGLLKISEYLMLSSFAGLMLLTLLHKHRWIVLRRIATIGSLLYFGRCVTMFVTQVPVADQNYYCSPKLSGENRTIGAIFLRALRVLSGVGLSINGKHTLCGDYIYSGHTVVFVTCYLFIREYSPRRWKLLHYTSAVASLVGVTCVVISRGHYTVDVILAYWISTRVFWQYHTMAAFAVLKDGRNENNHLMKVIWFPLFKFMEINVLRPLPRHYGLPAPLDRVKRLRFPKPNNR
ncbi:unnamed protein product [Bursaphelenchus okinawaensis]|uniref:Sphingomyelin synthase-like domain-containing protein n=1 Tax=Bursaphelenchus okinawaensis TaxID=465554 RepID=A0A811L3J6_9BILA|nr:unnamed protein product [Bursaphelenchus okinawaensis]CAG9115687.1 unnamed protein product [Bursaphelenchus okinawaensis]